ncbi:hypothetical protein CC86DRAFT_411023 [Ophiobolus disseminans]|uniref:DUF7029 domain-containing protein n=1 Tax=Ophiobolus disseminans TaxID=1469910 RepID=A0A6A6ZM66_9PLEO|nr:hypothetical protein CC86DRAFT_411023 [Ophiobolus disseminans]
MDVLVPLLIPPGIVCEDENQNVQTFTFEHKNATYVNLELLQAHGLTILSISFKDHGSYNRAKQHWQDGSDLLFVVEDASCIEVEDVRSIYSANSVSFSDDVPGVPVAVQIRATHKRFALDEPDTAMTLEIASQTIESTVERRYDTYKLRRRRRRLAVR